MSRFIHYTEIEKYRYKDDTSEEEDMWADKLLPLPYDEMPMRLQRKWLKRDWDQLIPIEQLILRNNQLLVDEQYPPKAPRTIGRPRKEKLDTRGLKLKFSFRYNPETGRIHRIGAADQDCEFIVNGLRYIWHNGRRYPSHRVAFWLKHYQDQLGAEESRKRMGIPEPANPEDKQKILIPARLGHINGDKLDNRWVNLRVLGLKKRLKVQVRYEGEIVNLGYVDTLEERAQRIEHYRGLRAIGIDHETAVHESKNGLK